jgi:hypothetical protein
MSEFIYTTELDKGPIGINPEHIITISKGSIKSTGEEVTMVRLSDGKEVVVKMQFDAFRDALK